MSRLPIWQLDDPATPAAAQAFLQHCREVTGEDPFNALGGLANHPAASGMVMQLIGFLRKQCGLNAKQAEYVWMISALNHGCYY
jgi:hypothetical protein